MHLHLLCCFSKVFTKIVHYYWIGVYTSYRRKYQISDTFRFNGQQILLYGDGEIICGDVSYIGDRTTLQSSLGFKISIGKGCHISSNVRIFTQTSIADADFSKKPVPSKFGNVTITNYCWIGANVLINPNIEIGENSVVGANSVVTKNIPAGEIWGGVPAKFIRTKLSC